MRRPLWATKIASSAGLCVDYRMRKENGEGACLRRLELGVGCDGGDEFYVVRFRFRDTEGSGASGASNGLKGSKWARTEDMRICTVNN